MLKFRFGGKTGRSFSLKESAQHIVVRTANRMPLTGDDVFAEAPLSRAARAVVGEFNLVARFQEAGVEVLRAVGTHAGKKTAGSSSNDLEERARDRICRPVIDRQPLGRANSLHGKLLREIRWRHFAARLCEDHQELRP